MITSGINIYTALILRVKEIHPSKPILGAQNWRIMPALDVTIGLSGSPFHFCNSNVAKVTIYIMLVKATSGFNVFF